MEIFILFSGGLRMAVRSELPQKAAGQSEQGSSGCCQQMSAEIQESKKCLGWVHGKILLIFCLTGGFWN